MAGGAAGVAGADLGSPRAVSPASVSISTRQVLNESFSPKSLRCARSAGMTARSQAARTAVIFTSGLDAAAPDLLEQHLRHAQEGLHHRRVEVGAGAALDL